MLKINDGLAFPIESKLEVEHMSFSGAGTGDIQVYGVKGGVRKYGNY